MIIKWNGIEWTSSGAKSKIRTYYIYWFDSIRIPENRKWGFDYLYYDGPHKSFCLWWFCITWSTPWTKIKKEIN